MTYPTTDTPTDMPVTRVNGWHPVEAAPTPVAPTYVAPAAACNTPTYVDPDRSVDTTPRQHPDTVAPDSTPTGRPVQHPDTTPRQSRATRRVLIAVSAALGFVILAPLALSGQDLYRWARSPAGLDLDQPWPWFVPVALDLAAAACIGMTIVAVWRRERAGVFGGLVWVFALVSAYGQHRHGIAERDAGRAQDLWWAMPAFAILGPLLLEVTLYKIRIWARKDAGEQHDAAAGFGRRWLPGVAFRETLAAWAASRREGIAKAGDAIQFVRDARAVRAMPRVEAVHYAFGALQSTDTHAARVWLSARNVSVTKADLDEATGVPTDTPTQAGSDTPTYRPTDMAQTDTPNMSAPPTPPKRAPRRGRPTRVGRRAAKKTTPPVDTPDSAPVGTPSAVALENAAALRSRYPDGLPSTYQIRKDTGWSPDRVKTARAAHTYLSAEEATP